MKQSLAVLLIVIHIFTLKKIDKYFKNAYLFSECIPGYHGENGNKSCGHCLNETACHHVYGMCDTECEPGQKDPYCTEGDVYYPAAVMRLYLPKKK